MDFTIDHQLLSQASAALSNRKRLYWILGGAGSGKSSVCQHLSSRLGLPVYDMDAHIYGDYHSRFTAERHPVNWAWATAENGLAWLLGMSWEEFNSFNEAAVPEYLDLMISDLQKFEPQDPILIDGGICNPAVLARAIPARQMICLVTADGWSALLWEEDEARQPMKAAVDQLPNAEAAWQKFLEFDQRINTTILKECRENNIPVYLRNAGESVAHVAGQAAQQFGF